LLLRVEDRLLVGALEGEDDFITFDDPFTYILTTPSPEFAPRMFCTITPLE